MLSTQYLSVVQEGPPFTFLSILIHSLERKSDGFRTIQKKNPGNPIPNSLLLTHPSDRVAYVFDSTNTKGQDTVCAPGPHPRGLAQSVSWLFSGHRLTQANLVWNALALVLKFLLCWQIGRHFTGVSG